MAYQTIPIPFEPLAAPEAVVHAAHVRFTVLTSRLLRLEYSPDDHFEDRPSEVAWFRRQPVPPFDVVKHAGQIEILTEHLHLVYRPNPAGFTPETLTISLQANGGQWHYAASDRQNLRGTGRTLDQADGAIRLEPGLLSRAGWAVVDDSNTLVFDSAGWLALRSSAAGSLDLYFLGYGHDYTACLQDYCKLSGYVPLIPRWALGNWWSRYWEYTQQELMDLMTEFRQREVPLSVCIVDMDWHLTRTDNRCSGWTGYTWNRDLFPDPQAFLDWLHTQGLRTALNLHPAEGVHPHEAAYPQMAQAMGVDPASRQPVRFDIADPEFTQHYFEILHHPQEDAGVDFWWMDWQQGEHLRYSHHPVAGQMDPLWWLNHLHFYDLLRGGTRRPFIFSRWGGLGNHRYPIGFSGDSVTSWASLAFQPYFTATAGNVAFGWWSHDIGGHFHGVEDAELYTRWVQFGVFSPIMRLHCTKNRYQDRRPWAFGADVFHITQQAMQLRHALIPYLYSMAWRMTQTGVPLVAPMYYQYPEAEEAYQARDQYLFGDQLLAAPFISPANAETGLSRTVVWLPEGEWYHFFSGEVFHGGRWLPQYGLLEDVPVFARAGAIVPLGPRVGWGGVQNPAELQVQIFAGADGQFNLYEDDGVSSEYQEGHFSILTMHQHAGEQHLYFSVDAASGSTAHLPPLRDYQLTVWGVRLPKRVTAMVSGRPVEVVWSYDSQREALVVRGLQLKPEDWLELALEVREGALCAHRDRRLDTARKYLQAFRMDSWGKISLDAVLEAAMEDATRLDSFSQALGDARLTALRSALEPR